MGSVTRLVVWFDDVPWRSPSRFPNGADLDRVGFIHLAEGAFNVWWSAYPADVPLAVAWCGGPLAALHSGRSRSEVEGIAFSSLAQHIGVSRKRVTSHVRDTWTHDWTADPFARGAYSYVRVGGGDAAKALAKPIRSTLFFSGEATDADASGTVEGALASGERAAAQVKRALEA
jgi:flavin-dependent amine oxidoreductase